MVGSACCRSVRAAISVVAVCLREPRARDHDGRDVGEHEGERALATSIAALSTMSWLVAPRWT